jgi:protocatechuate 4,5-dioxygenase, alpha chain
MTTNGQPLAGTTIFDGDQAIKGYALNKMCMSFNDAANRAEFLRDEDAYCARYGLSPAQREAVRHRNVLELIAAGGNIYYLAKFAGIFGLDVQDIGAQQTGVTKAEFQARLLAEGRQRHRQGGRRRRTGRSGSTGSRRCTGRSLAIPRCPACDQLRGSGGLRRDDVPGDGGAPRGVQPDAAAVAGRCAVAGAHRPCGNQHRPVPAAVGRPLLGVRPGDRAGRRFLPVRRAGGGHRHRRAAAVLGAGSGGDVGVREVAATYHVPISNTAAGMMLLEPAG